MGSGEYFYSQGHAFLLREERPFFRWGKGVPRKKKRSIDKPENPRGTLLKRGWLIKSEK